VTGIFHIVLARKPLEGTIAENCLQWGCGALWIDGTRVGIDDGSRTRPPSKPTMTTFAQDKWTQNPSNRKPFDPLGQGRFPANLIIGGEEVLVGFPQARSSGDLRSPTQHAGGCFGGGLTGLSNNYADSGSASRFFFNFSEQESDE